MTNSDIYREISCWLVTELVKRNVRSFDVVCRFGGEEFTVILPECPSVRCRAIVAKEFVRHVRNIISLLKILGLEQNNHFDWRSKFNKG